LEENEEILVQNMRFMNKDYVLYKRWRKYILGYEA